MLYIFFVGSGTMMTFDMNLAVENVAALQTAIEKTCGILVDKQVLLISGGATLDPSVKVCNYGAGTDTNPIFLFTKFMGDDEFQTFGSSMDSDSDMNMKERVEAFENMAADYQTLAARSQLAREFADMALHERKLCSQLVDSQHLQQQGWAAVIANLEDTTNSLKRHVDLLESESQQYFESRPLYQDLLKNFDEAVDLMAKVPVLPSLVSQGSCAEGSSQPQQTLLTKYCSEPRVALEKMAEQCKKWIDQFNEDTLAKLKSEAKKVISTAEDPSMKEVKGIEDRLFRLNQLMDGASKCAEEQCKFAEALNIHHNRVSSTNDMSVLNDLCRAHQIQLKDMLKNHMCLRDTRERCMKAKIELCDNLQTRVKWVTYSQNQIFFLNNKLAVYRENLHRLRDHLNVIQQIHLAPTIYVKTLAEIRRRKNFSTSFLKWASNLSDQALELYKKEVNARNAFNGSRSQNFIYTLFPGMDDFPPPFATECPKPFDTLLPNVSQEDLENLKKQLPELAGFMFVPPTDQMPQVSHKSVVSDSAFSSEVPSSQYATTGPSQSCASLQGVQMFRTETASSLDVAEGTSGPQDLPSPVSPFEDPFLPSNSDIEVLSKHVRPHSGKKADDSGVECKRLHLNEGLAEREMFSPIEEEQNNVESDGDEFERVDSLPKLYDPCNALPDGDVKRCDTKKGQAAAAASAEPQVPSLNREASSSHPAGDLPQVSPSDERLRTPDSMLTSHDFHSADYFIDDSMPSSYTESTGASAFGKGHHMVKSHHVIVAELQHQLDNKSAVLSDAQGSQPMSRSNTLKLHATLSAFQRFVREVMEQLKTDLQRLKGDVQKQKADVGEGFTGLVEKVNATIGIVQVQAELERVKCERLSQQSQIASSMMLEHELELENLREEGKKKLLEKDEEIDKLKQAVTNKQTQIHMLGIEKENIEADLRDKLQKEQEEWLEAMEEKYKQQQQNGQAEIERLQKEISELEGKFQTELLLKMEEKEKALKELFEKDKESVLSEQRSHLQKQKEEDLKKLHESIQTFAEDSSSKEKETQELQRKLDEALRNSSTLQTALEEAKAGADQVKSELTFRLQEQAKNYEDEIKELKSQMQEMFTNKDNLHAQEMAEMCKKFEEASKQGASVLADLERVKSESRQEMEEAVDLKRKLVEEYETEMGKLKIENQGLLEKMTLYETQIKEQQSGHEAAAERQKSSEECREEVNQLQTAMAKLTKEKEEIVADYESRVEKLKNEKELALNEALTKVAKDKEGVIESLKSQLIIIEKWQENFNSILNQLLEEYRSKGQQPAAGVAEPVCTVPSECVDVASKFVEDLKKRLQLPELPLHAKHDEGLLKAATSKIKELEKELQKEKDKFAKLCSNVSKTSSHNKISVVTCEAGDIVLFCYDEKHKNYLAFYFGSVPHFLHTESLSLLNLKIPPESPRSSWALAMVVDKDYCLAKKAVNRFNVPSGSRFFRVKVKPWLQDAPIKHSLHPRVSLTDISQTQSVTVPSSSSEGVSGAEGGGEESEPKSSLSASTI